MPKFSFNEKLRGDMPPEAQPVGEIVSRLKISRPYLIELIKSGEIPGWLYLNQFYYCVEADVVRKLAAKAVDPQPEIRHN